MPAWQCPQKADSCPRSHPQVRLCRCLLRGQGSPGEPSTESKPLGSSEVPRSLRTWRRKPEGRVQRAQAAKANIRVQVPALPPMQEPSSLQALALNLQKWWNHITGEGLLCVCGDLAHCPPGAQTSASEDDRGHEGPATRRREEAERPAPGVRSVSNKKKKRL